MSRINKIVKKLLENPEKEYGLSEITQEGLFPWAKDFKTISLIVGRDMRADNLLKTKVIGERQGRRYVIKAKNIAKFLETYGAGLMIIKSRN